MDSIRVTTAAKILKRSRARVYELIELGFLQIHYVDGVMHLDRAEVEKRRDNPPTSRDRPHKYINPILDKV